MRIFQDSRHVSACRSCGAPIEWAESAGTGAKIPFNAPIRTVAVLLPVIIAGRIIEDVDAATISHFAMCPQRNDWRRTR